MRNFYYGLSLLLQGALLLAFMSLYSDAGTGFRDFVSGISGLLAIIGLVAMIGGPLMFWIGPVVLRAYQKGDLGEEDPGEGES